MRRTRSAMTWVLTSGLTLAFGVGVVAMTARPSVPQSSRVTAVTPSTGPQNPTTTAPSPTIPPTTIVRYGGDDGSSYGSGGASPYGDN